MLELIRQEIIHNKTISIYSNSKSICPHIYLNWYEDNTDKMISILNEKTKKDFALVLITNLSWNKDMSPWIIEKVFEEEDEYVGKADKMLSLITQEIKTLVNSILPKPSFNVISGYSLSALFALYSIYKTDFFEMAVSVSGSLWYPNFLSFAREHSFSNKVKKVYLSLGDREDKTKNKLLSTVKTNTEAFYCYLKEQNIETTLNYNEGNHFKDPEIRMEKGISWILN